MADDDDTDKAFRELAEQLASQEKNQGNFARLVKDPISAPAVRAYITKFVVGSYIIYLFGIGIYIVACGDTSREALLMDIMKTLFLPIVTLMIGHYFGSKSD